jgi:hypothetical protein
MVSFFPLKTPSSLDTANLTINSGQPARLNFVNVSPRTFQVNYLLQQEGDYLIHVASRDSSDTVRSGDRAFTVVAAKAAGGIVSALNGAVRLSIPPGAVTHDELWVVCAAAEPGNPGASAMGPVFQIGPAGRALSVPARLTLRYDTPSLDGRAAALLGICQSSGGQWHYVLSSVDAAAGTVSASIAAGGVYQLCWSESFPTAPPGVAAPLSANPNPFGQTTAISYQLGAPAHVSLKVYNITGRLVRTLSDGVQAAGNHTVVWDGTGERNQRLPSGVYHYRLRTAGRDCTGRIVKIQ